MEKISDEMKKIIRSVLDLEKAGARFFEMAEENSENELGKKTFARLALDEKEHFEAFSEIFSEITGSKEWRRFYRDEEKNLNSPIIQKLTTAFETVYGRGEMEALRVGLDLEKSAMELVKELKRQAKDPMVTEALIRILEEEEGNYDMLQAQLDAIGNTGFWFDAQEFRVDGRY